MEKGHTIELPPHGFVRLISWHGTDTTIVEAARVSFGEAGKGPEQDKKLLMYLYKHRHTSPFEQCSVTFNIRLPIFVMRQFVRHRMFKLNEFSARYKELPDQFYRPASWRKQNTEGNKQGSSESTGIDQVHINELVDELYHKCYNTYEQMLAEGVAKEQARMIMPVAAYTEIYVQCDLHNLTHFLRLRTDAHAQKEIQDVALMMEKIATELFPWTFEAYRKFKFKVIEE